MKIKNLLIALFTFLIVCTSNAAQFTPGNIVVVRVGSTGSLVNTGSPVFLDEYTPAGTFVQSIALPTTVSGLNKQLILSGVATSEGFSTLSADGRYIILTGYGRDLGGSGSLAGTSGATVNRVVGRVDIFGNVNTETGLTDYADGNNPRSGTSADGTAFWVTGGAGGVRYVAAVGNSTSTQLSTGSTNLRIVNIFSGQLYASTGSGSLRVTTVGTGLPTTAGQTITNLPGVQSTGTSPYGYFFADLDAGVAGNDVLYVAYDDANGLTKYSLVGGTWTSNGIVGIAADAYRGLTGSVSGTTVTLYATRKGGSTATGGGELVSLVDASGYNGAFAGTPTLLATAAANTAFRGITFAPNSASISSTGTINAGTYKDITISNGSVVNISGNVTITGTLTFAGNSILASGINQIILPNTASDPNEAPSTGRIIGQVVVEPRLVGTGSFNYLGVGLNAGTDNIGSLAITRFTGPSGIVNNGPFTGIASSWDISSTNPPASGRNLTLSWLSVFDNGKIAPFIVWKNEGFDWNPFGPAIPSITDPRQVTVTTTSFSSWTVSDVVNPLPVELSNFIAHSIRNEVILDWSTAQELNNSYFDIERVKIDMSGKQTGNFSKVGTVRGAGTTNNTTHYKYTDNNVETGKYLYRLNQVDYNGNNNIYVLSSEIIVGVPNKFDLSQNYPNPFNPVTKINYELPQDLNVSLKVYDINGKEVATLVNEVKAAGYHTAEFNGMNMASGIYFIRLNAGQFSSVKKMNLIK